MSNYKNIIREDPACQNSRLKKSLARTQKHQPVEDALMSILAPAVKNTNSTMASAIGSNARPHWNMEIPVAANLKKTQKRHITFAVAVFASDYIKLSNFLSRNGTVTSPLEISELIERYMKERKTGCWITVQEIRSRFPDSRPTGQVISGFLKKIWLCVPHMPLPGDPDQKIPGFSPTISDDHNILRAGTGRNPCLRSLKSIGWSNSGNPVILFHIYDFRGVQL